MVIDCMKIGIIASTKRIIINESRNYCISIEYTNLLAIMFNRLI